MMRLASILGIVLALYCLMLFSDPAAATVANHQSIGQRIGFQGVLALGAGILIISGGIDLSMGAVVGLGAVTFALLLEGGWSPWLAVAAVLAQGMLIGASHGLLVTKLRLQPFLVTLCGLFIYRGLARWATWTEGGSSRNVGIVSRLSEVRELQYLATDRFLQIPTVLLLLLVLAGLAAVFLHASVYGRYLYAIGANEQAARYAGINTDRYKILAYVLCSTLAALGGVLYMLEIENASPANAGAWYELYAITAAVLGGCSLRGGEGTIAGILLGTSMLPLLRNFCLFYGVPDDLQFTVIGIALLVGTIIDEVWRRLAERLRQGKTSAQS